MLFLNNFLSFYLVYSFNGSFKYVIASEAWQSHGSRAALYIMRLLRRSPSQLHVLSFLNSEIQSLRFQTLYRVH